MDINNLCMGCMREKSEGMVKCLKCGYVDNSPYLPSYLAPKTVLKERYLVGKVLSYNGSGATYIGYDMIVNCKVKIREYMPENLASREKGDPKVKASAGSEIQYKSLKMDFMDLAKHLVKLNSLSEVEHVNDMFEENNTAYIVYEYVEGMTLSEFLKKNGGYISWDDTKQLFMPLLSCMNAIHASEIIHRGISPETIIVDRSGNLKLTAFDIAPARTARSELVAQLYAGYAAPEQYASSAWQGTFTDVYALAATIYRAVTGTMPIEAISRVSNDNLVPAISLNPSIPRNVSNALVCAMLLSPEKRTETVSLLISQLSEVMDFGEQIPDLAPERKERKKLNIKLPAFIKNIKISDSVRYALIAAGISIPVLVIIGIILMGSLFPSSDKPSTPTSSLGSTSMFPSTSSNTNSGIAGDETSTNANFKYSIPSFVGKEIDPILHDEDYTEKFELVVEYEFNEEVEAQKVITQSIDAGTPVAEDGTEIILVVSRGSRYRKLSNLVGKDVNKAKDILNNNYIRYQVEVDEGNYGDSNKVCAMSKKAGTKLDITELHTITLYVYDDKPVEEEVSSKPDESWVEDLE